MKFTPFLITKYKSIIGAWVEAELLNLNPAYFADASDNTNISQFIGIRSNNLSKYANNIKNIGLIYKKISPVFRWVACALLAEKVGNTSLKPSANHKRIIANEFAQFIEIFNRYIPKFYTDIFKSPLKILVEFYYLNNYNFAYDELSILFALLCESMGIKSILIFDEKSKIINVGLQLYTVYTDTNYKKDNYENYTVFDFSTKPFECYEYYYDNNKFIVELDVMDNIDIEVINLETNLVKDYVDKGLYARNKTEYWNNNKILLDVDYEWFRELVESRLDYLNTDFSFLSTIERNDDKFLIFNKGAETTGAILAKLSYYIGNKYKVIKKYVINNIFKQNDKLFNAYEFTKRGNYDYIKVVLQGIFYFVKNRFKYSEEMLGVEQIASPLNILYIDSFYRHILKYDCDDLTLLFLTLVESINIKNNKGKKLFKGIVRLAGNSDDKYKNKFHVYPVLRFNNYDEVVYDVSSGNIVGWEMNRGNNYLDFEIDNSKNYNKYLNNSFENYNFEY